MKGCTVVQWSGLLLHDKKILGSTQVSWTLNCLQVLKCLCVWLCPRWVLWWTLPDQKTEGNAEPRWTCASLPMKSKKLSSKTAVFMLVGNILDNSRVYSAGCDVCCNTQYTCAKCLWDTEGCLRKPRYISGSLWIWTGLSKLFWCVWSRKGNFWGSSPSNGTHFISCSCDILNNCACWDRLHHPVTWNWISLENGWRDDNSAALENIPLFLISSVQNLSLFS